MTLNLRPYQTEAIGNILADLNSRINSAILLEIQLNGCRRPIGRSRKPLWFCLWPSHLSGTATGHKQNQGGFLMKKCGKCQQVKPYSEFHKNKTRPDGYASRCKECCKAHVRADNSVCQWCNKSYYAYTSSHKKYCSRECSAAARDRKIKVECLNCGKKFKTHRCNPNWGYGKYCSKSCALSHTRSGENGYQWKGGPVTLTCLNCGKEFKAKPYRKDDARFCSRECNYEYSVGENHPCWRGGPSLYPPKFNHKFKMEIRNRDRFTCALCGKYGKQVHHIDYIKENTYPENCITLCKRCHPKTNAKRDEWELFFKNLMIDRGHC